MGHRVRRPEQPIVRESPDAVPGWVQYYFGGELAPLHLDEADYALHLRFPPQARISSDSFHC